MTNEERKQAEEIMKVINAKMPSEELPQTYDELKSLCCNFFRHWWNTPGSNTDEGFDKWFRNRMDSSEKPNNCKE